MSERTRRVDHLLQEEISAIIRRELHDPRVGFVTITGVDVTPDLRHATVWASVIGDAQERRATLQVLGRAMPFVRHQLGPLRLRRIPELHLREDDTAERGTRVMQLLEQLEAAGPEGAVGGLRGRPGAARPAHAARAQRAGPAESRRPPASQRRRSRPATAGASTASPCARPGNAVVAEPMRSLRQADLDAVPPELPVRAAGRPTRHDRLPPRPGGGCPRVGARRGAGAGGPGRAGQRRLRGSRCRPCTTSCRTSGASARRRSRTSTPTSSSSATAATWRAWGAC